MIKQLTYRPIKYLAMIALLFSSYLVSGQCHEVLREEVYQLAGIDAFHLKELPVKLKAGTMKSPVRFQKYKTQLDSGVTYRITILNNPEYEGNLIMQLMDRNEVLGSTFNIATHQDKTGFDFTIEETKTYTILSSFREGKKGCALGVLSMVVQDSLAMLDHRVTSDSVLESLYMGIENPITVAMAAVENGYMEVNLTDGIINKDQGQYYVKPSKLGLIDIVSTTFNQSGEMQESDTTTFKVIDLPSPTPTLQGRAGGLISKSDVSRLQQAGFVWGIADDEMIKVQNLIISNSQFGVRSYESIGLNVTLSQRNFILSLEANDSFYVRLRVEMPDGTVRVTDPVAFAVY